MEFTPEQAAAVDHDGRCVVVRGGPGTGKTTVLMERCRRRPDRSLVLCRNRPAADRFVAGTRPLPTVTTIYGLALDLVARAGSTARLLPAAERRVLIGRLLATEDPADWPTLGRFLRRRGLVAEVAAALDLAFETGVDNAAAAGGPWAELAGFAGRYTAALQTNDYLDFPGLAAEAATLAPSHRERFDHVVVDDAHVLGPSAVRLLRALVGDDLSFTLATALGPPPLPGAEITLTQTFRVAAPGRLIRCDHPSLEPEAIAAELWRQHEHGTPWAEQAVVVSHLGRRARSIGRALARHGIPVVPVPALAADEPVVRAVVDMLRWVDGDDAALERLLVSPLGGLSPREVRDVRREAQAAGRPVDDDSRLAPLVELRQRLRERRAAGDTPADLAYEVWAHSLAGTGSNRLGAVDDRALDGLVAFIDGLAAASAPTDLAAALAAIDEGSLVPDPWRASVATGPDGVTITSIAEAEGREWPTVVVAGCVEGELPRARPASPVFDVSRLGVTAPTLADERRRFTIATTRATVALVATAAPAPGVLLSRFVEAWPAEPALLATAPGQAFAARPVTAGTVPVAPDRCLTLSATQLDTYDDCPLRYAYQYVLRARDEPGVHASLGTLVHAVLADFCDPDAPDPAPRSLEGLLGVAARHWHDDVARYRPQVEEVRRDLVAMLTAWWEQEGCLAPEVLAVERRFEIEVGPHKLVGSIDRVDRAPDGGLGVIDYKTSKKDPAPDEVLDDLQLAVYHLAATRDEGLAALGAPTQLQLRYLRSMRTFSQPVTDDHVERTEARVLAVAERILAEEFEPSVDANCRTCNFHRLCPLQDAGRMT